MKSDRLAHNESNGFGSVSRTCLVVSERRWLRCSISWASSCANVANSSAGDWPGSSVILPPWDRPFAGAMRSETQHDAFTAANPSQKRRATTYYPSLGIPRRRQERSSDGRSRAALPATIDRHGDRRSLTRDDILIVAPYNDQVNRLRDQLPGARAGTVE